jgi:hypothetical protein
LKHYFFPLFLACCSLFAQEAPLEVFRADPESAIQFNARVNSLKDQLKNAYERARKRGKK